MPFVSQQELVYLALQPGVFHSRYTDVLHYVQLLDTVAHHAHVRVEDCSTCYDRLKKAAALYRGELLAGFYFNSLPFEEWLSEQRDHSFPHA